MIKGFFFLMYVQSLVDQFKFSGASCVTPLHTPLHSSLHFYVAPTEVSRTYSIAGYVTAADQPGLGWAGITRFRLCSKSVNSHWHLDF